MMLKKDLTAGELRTLKKVVAKADAKTAFNPMTDADALQVLSMVFFRLAYVAKVDDPKSHGGFRFTLRPTSKGKLFLERIKK